MTATKQDYARKYGYAIDQVTLGAEVGKMDQNLISEEGRWVNGMLLEGAYWLDQHLSDPIPTVRQQPMPPVLLLPSVIDDKIRAEKDKKPISMYEKTSTMYSCPIYRTSDRRGTLSTTGHSTNFVMHLELPTGECSESIWTKRGTAIVLASSD